jgi:radical SAM superfamily enzyme YgiQ (UPF0313 family)
LIYKDSKIKHSVYRYHSPKEIVRVIKKYKKKYKFNHIQFIDENISTMPLKVLEELSKLYKKEVNVGFFCMARPEPIVAEPRKAKLLADMGCVMVALGAESGNEELKKRILNRPMKNEILIKASKLLRDEGILISLYNIIGFPEETKDMIFDTIKLNKIIQPDRYSVRFLVPYQGTPIRDYCFKKGYLKDDKKFSFLIEPTLNLPSPPHPTKSELIYIKENFGRYIKGELREK